MPQGIEVLYWGLTILFCLVMGFAILLWCRSWRREERAETERQLQLLAREVRRLNTAVEAVEQAGSALHTADEQFAEALEDLRQSVGRLEVRPAVSSSSEVDVSPADRPEMPAETRADRYARARAMLLKGESPVDVARGLDIGPAEVRMIARMLELEASPSPADALPPQKTQKRGE